MRVTDKHVFFWGETFSNFCPAPFVDSLGRKFYNSEQYFMYYKATYFNDTETAEKILRTDKPLEAKMLGRQVKDYNDFEWSKVRYDIMYKANKLKYDNNPKLKEELMSYNGKTFVEASPEDCIWGVGMSENNPLVDDEKNWYGSNLLGKVLTELRDFYVEQDLKEKEENDEDEYYDIPRIKPSLNQLIQEYEAEEIIEAFGIEEIVDKVDKDDILNKIDAYDVVRHYDIDDLLYHVDDDDIAEYLDRSGFDFSKYIEDDDTEEDENIDFSPKEALMNICRYLHPRAYIGKEEMKKIVCDYIDFNFTN